MMHKICAVLPRSAALARQIHHSDLRRVISWGLGDTAATQGISMKGKSTQRGIITSRFNTHTRLHTHRNRDTCPLMLRTCKSTVQTSSDSWTESARPSAQGVQSNCSLQDHIKKCYTTHLKDWFNFMIPMKKAQRKCVTGQPKQSPCSSLLNISSAKATSDLQQNYSKFKARTG